MSRPKVLELEITTSADAAMGDPALLALLEKGYTVGFVWSKTLDEEGRKRLYLMVMLVPPSAAPIARQLDAVVGAVEAVDARMVVIEGLSHRRWLGSLSLVVAVLALALATAVHWW